MHSDPFTAAVAEAEALVTAAPFIETDADLAEGLHYLAQGIAATLHQAFDGEREHPHLGSGTGPFAKMGLDNPDTLYFGARVDGAREYVVTGRRGTTCDLSFQVLGGGEYTDDNVPVSAIAFDDRELEINPDGTFEVRFGPGEPERDQAGGNSGGGAPPRVNNYRLPPGKAQLVMREVYSDWSERRGTLTIARTDTVGTAPPPATPAELDRRYALAGKLLVNRVKTWLQFPKWFYDTLEVNTMTAPRLTPGGLATQYSSVGHYDLTDEQAMILTVPASDAPYQGFQLGSRWYVSLDYINHQTSLNTAQARIDPDGMVRLVIAARDPGLTNWIETTGHRRGYLQLRWQRTSREFTAADGPVVEVVPAAELAARLPFHDDQTITPEGWRNRIAARQAGVQERMLG